jgi:hypothetical protein
MNTLCTSASALNTKRYTIKSPYAGYFGLLRDAPRDQAWELFGIPSLPAYFTRGMDTFYETQGLEKQLPFMLESLLYVRKAIAEVEEPLS